MAPTNTCSHCVTRGHLVLLHQVLVSFVLCPENLRLYKTGFCFFLAGLTLWVCHFPLCPSEGAISSCPSVPAPSPAPGVVAGAPETAVHRVARGALSTAANLWWVGRAPSCTAPYPAQPHIPHSPVSHTAPCTWGQQQLRQHTQLSSSQCADFWQLPCSPACQRAFAS